jgi:predicted methyltransferase
MGEGVSTRSDGLGRHSKREVEAAGFILVAEGDFLRHPEDKRDPLSSRAPMPIDEFILKFEKPR